MQTQLNRMKLENICFQLETSVAIVAEENTQ